MNEQSSFLEMQSGQEYFHKVDTVLRSEEIFNIKITKNKLGFKKGKKVRLEERRSMTGSISESEFLNRLLECWDKKLKKYCNITELYAQETILLLAYTRCRKLKGSLMSVGVDFLPIENVLVTIKKISSQLRSGLYEFGRGRRMLIAKKDLGVIGPRSNLSF